MSDAELIEAIARTLMSPARWKPSEMRGVRPSGATGTGQTQPGESSFKARSRP